jgi:hypothetical protein
VLLWLLLPLAFFSAAASKLPGYILPCLPPLALLSGRVAAGLDAETPRQRLWLWMGAFITLIVGLLAAAGPFLLARRGEATWTWLVPAGSCALLIGALAFGPLVRSAPSATSLLRAGAAGLLVLLAIGLPPILERRESGRLLFGPAAGREVLAFGAWRTAWMSGYFYNDARVRQVESLAEVGAATVDGPTLVLCGPAERRQLELAPSFNSRLLAEGPRSNVLLEVTPRR